MSWRRIPLVLAVLALGSLGAGSAPPATSPVAPEEPSASPPAAPASKTVRLRLDNGLRVVLRPVEGARRAAVVVLYTFGEGSDPSGRSGLGHLVEHCYFTAAAGRAKARSFEQFVQQYSLGWNAQTGDRHTLLATVVLRSELEDELADAAARMGGLRVEETDLQREKPRIVGEVTNMFGGFPQLAARNLAREQLLPLPSTRKGGLPEQVNAATLSEVQDRLQRYYKPRNAILAVAGGFDAAAARRWVEADFGPLPAGEDALTPRTRGSAPVTKRGAATPVKEVEVDSSLPAAPAEACMAYAAPLPGARQYPAFLALAAGMSARRVIGAPDGSVSVMYMPLDTPEAIYVTGRVQPEESPAAAITRLERVQARMLKDAGRGDAVQAQALLRSTWLMDENPDLLLGDNAYGLAFSLARREQLGLDGERLTKEISRLTDAAILRCRRDVFSPARRAAVVAVPKRDSAPEGSSNGQGP